MNETRTVRIWVGNEFMTEFEEEKDADISEEDFSNEVADYVWNNMWIEII